MKFSHHITTHDRMGLERVVTVYVRKYRHPELQHA